MHLKEPSAYLGALEALRRKERHARSLNLRLERRTNAHCDCSGKPWGWYEIYPIGVDVGFWGDGRDDLGGVDISAWNREAERISQTIYRAEA